MSDQRPEQSIASARASIMVYDESIKKWIPSGTSHGLSKVHIYHHFINNTFRVVGRKLQDHEVVLNCGIMKSLKYNEATATFHQWRDQKTVYGLNFSCKEDADVFAAAMYRALEVLNYGTGLVSNTPSSSGSQQQMMHCNQHNNNSQNSNHLTNNTNAANTSLENNGHQMVNVLKSQSINAVTNNAPNQCQPSNNNSSPPQNEYGVCSSSEERMYFEHNGNMGCNGSNIPPSSQQQGGGCNGSNLSQQTYNQNSHQHGGGMVSSGSQSLNMNSAMGNGGSVGSRQSYQHQPSSKVFESNESGYNSMSGYPPMMSSGSGVSGSGSVGSHQGHQMSTLINSYNNSQNQLPQNYSSSSNGSPTGSSQFNNNNNIQRGMYNGIGMSGSNTLHHVKSSPTLLSQQQPLQQSSVQSSMYQQRQSYGTIPEQFVNNNPNQSNGNGNHCHLTDMTSCGSASSPSNGGGGAPVIPPPPPPPNQHQYNKTSTSSLPMSISSTSSRIPPAPPLPSSSITGSSSSFESSSVNMSGLALALQNAKLRKTSSSIVTQHSTSVKGPSAPAPVPVPAASSMLDEMQKTLARRRAKAENKGVVEDDRQSSASPLSNNSGIRGGLVHTPSSLSVSDLGGGGESRSLTTSSNTVSSSLSIRRSIEREFSQSHNNAIGGPSTNVSASDSNNTIRQLIREELKVFKGELMREIQMQMDQLVNRLSCSNEQLQNQGQLNRN